MPARLSPFGAALLALAGCNVSEDPADGGFVAGVQGLSQGTYEARIAEREAAITAEQARGAQLRAELGQAEAEYASLRRRLIEQRSSAAAAGRPLPPELDAEVLSVLQDRPAGRGDAERLQSYREAVAEARALSARLAGL